MQIRRLSTTSPVMDFVEVKDGKGKDGEGKERDYHEKEIISIVEKLLRYFGDIVTALNNVFSPNF